MGYKIGPLSPMSHFKKKKNDETRPKKKKSHCMRMRLVLLTRLSKTFIHIYNLKSHFCFLKLP